MTPEDDDGDLSFLAHRRRRSSVNWPMIGITVGVLLMSLVAISAAVYRLNQGVEVPSVIQAQPRPGDVIPPATNMGTVYVRLIIFMGLGLTVMGAFGFAVMQGMQQQKRRRRQPTNILVWVALYTIPLVLMALPSAYYMAHYSPMFGDLWIVALAQPHSPARDSVVPIHMFAFGLAGVAIGTILGVLTWLSRR